MDFLFSVVKLSSYSFPTVWNFLTFHVHVCTDMYAQRTSSSGSSFLILSLFVTWSQVLNFSLFSYIITLVMAVSLFCSTLPSILSQSISFAPQHHLTFPYPITSSHIFSFQKEMVKNTQITLCFLSVCCTIILCER